MFSARYLTEVLGIKSYVCPADIRALRHLEGGLPCRCLVVVFNSFNSSQKALLKKIMSSIEIFKYSVLAVKEEKILEELFEKADQLAQFICFFGGKDFVQEGKLIRSEGRLISALNERSSCSFFQTACSLEELEGHSVSVRDKKQQLWNQLKIWKNISSF